MKIENSIGWTDETTNAVTGCDKVSPGCKNCYAAVGTRARVLRAQGVETWGPKGVRQPVNFEPVFRRLNKMLICDKCHNADKREALSMGDDRQESYCAHCKARASLRRIRLFADSNSDWLDDKWPVETLARFLDAIRLAPNIDTILLTKRIEDFERRLCAVRQSAGEDAFYANSAEAGALSVWIDRWVNGKPPAHVWLGVSVEDQQRSDERIPQLLKTPAAVRFLSCEPLLEPVDLRLTYGVGVTQNSNTVRGNEISWVIVGGESGDGRRDCGVAAIESVADQCVAAGVPVFVKQDTAFKSGQRGRISEKHWALKQFPHG